MRHIYIGHDQREEAAFEGAVRSLERNGGAGQWQGLYADKLAACGLLLVARVHGLAWPIVFVLGAAGSSLYTLSMTDIGAREQGLTLVNSTAVLVLNYTLGGLVASAISGVLIDWSPTIGFPIVLIAVAAIGLVALLRTRRSGTF